MVKNKRMSELGSVSLGFSFRGAIPIHEDGDLFVVQAKNIFSNSDIEKSGGLIQTKSSLVGGAQRLQKGDVLLTIRSIGPSGFKAGVCGDVGKDIIASSSVCVIRVFNEEVLPQYLALYFNSAEGQAVLMRNSSGSMVRALLLGNIRTLEVPLPEIEKQRNLIGLLHATRAHKQLMEKKKELLQNIDHYAISHIIEPAAV